MPTEPQTILLTGCRAPATLDLAKLLASAGHTLIGADSCPRHCCRRSRVFSTLCSLPSPRDDLQAYGDALSQIIQQHDVQWLIPTCEETFHVAMLKDRLDTNCRVFCMPEDVMMNAHHKGRFIEKAKSFGLAVPETLHFEANEDGRTALAEWLSDKAIEQYVLKPAYSRFGTQVSFFESPQLPSLKSLQGGQGSWVAQRRLTGQQVCSYSVAHHGKLSTHTAYPVEFTAGNGAAVHFKAVDDPVVREWVTEFVRQSSFTGQIAFDFIREDDGSLYAIECNPRLTSGIHLFADHPKAAAAFLGETSECLEPDSGKRAMIGFAMLLYGFRGIRGPRQFGRWLANLLFTPDRIWRAGSVRGLISMLETYHYFQSEADRLGISVQEATTHDIRYDG